MAYQSTLIRSENAIGSKYKVRQGTIGECVMLCFEIPKTFISSLSYYLCQDPKSQKYFLSLV